MDDLLSKAEVDRTALSNRLERLEAQADEVRAELAEVDGFLRRYRRYTGVSETAGVPVTTFPVTRSIQVSTSPRRELKPGSTGDRMVSAVLGRIAAIGRPVSIGEALDAVTAAKFEVGGVRPTTNLSSVLSRSDRIGFKHGIGWFAVAATADETETATPIQGSPFE